MSGLTIKTEKPDKNLTILRLSGEFEGYAALDGKEELLRCAADTSCASLMLDMAGIEYIDSAALGILLEMSKIAANKKISLGLIHVLDPVKKVIQVTQLDKVLKILDR